MAAPWRMSTTISHSGCNIYKRPTYKSYTPPYSERAQDAIENIRKSNLDLQHTQCYIRMQVLEDKRALQMQSHKFWVSFPEERQKRLFCYLWVTRRCLSEMELRRISPITKAIRIYQHLRETWFNNKFIMPKARIAKFI